VKSEIGDMIHRACGHAAKFHCSSGCLFPLGEYEENLFCKCSATFEDVIKQERSEISYARRAVENI